MRQIVLDTETTGLDPDEGHRIIEIGCVELVNRRLTGNNFHQYLQPDREIDDAAIDVHGITNEFLKDKARFPDIADDFIEYIRGAELIIHNAPFDVGFLDNEFKLMSRVSESGNGPLKIDGICTITDTLKMARSMNPGQKNNLDALCKRYEIDNSQRTLHGALLDSEILADVYLAMTGGQVGIFDDGASTSGSFTGFGEVEIRRLPPDRPRLRTPSPTDEELRLHEQWLDELDRKTDGQCIWKHLTPSQPS